MIEIKIIIENSLWQGARAKRYRATPEQIERNKREILIQRERDERARKLALNIPVDSDYESLPQTIL